MSSLVCPVCGGTYTGYNPAPAPHYHRFFECNHFRYQTNEEFERSEHYEEWLWRGEQVRRWCELYAKVR